jgi:hypothetical protein
VGTLRFAHPTPASAARASGAESIAAVHVGALEIGLAPWIGGGLRFA